MIPFDANAAFDPRPQATNCGASLFGAQRQHYSAAGLALAAQVISTVILARLLTPTDFGVVKPRT